MSHYLGSKARHAEQIIAQFMPRAKQGGCYVEPFVGGANVLAQVPQGVFGRRIAADRNKYMVALHNALANGWQPPVIFPVAEYKAMKKWVESDRAQRAEPNKYPPELVAFVGVGCSFGSMWFSTFAKDDKDKPAGTRCRQSAESCLRDVPGLIGTEFYHSDYDKLAEMVAVKTDVQIPADALWYCDPPYAKTTGYEGASQIIEVGDSLGVNEWKADKFWKWADRLADNGATVFVSEYTGPNIRSMYTAPDGLEAAAMGKEVDRLAKCDTADDPETIRQREDLRARRAAIVLEESERFYASKDRWKVVWEKEVSVNIAGGAVGAAREAGNEDAAPKKETEKLFTRVS